MKSIVILILLISSETFAQPLNNWLQFDGTNDFIDLGKSTMLKPTAALTVEIWAFNSNWSTMGDSRFISNTESGGYFIGAEGDYIKAYIMLNNTYNIPSVKLSSLSDGWHHFALTCDGRYTKLYVDGTLQDTEDAGAAYLIQYSASANNTFIGAEAGSGTTPVSSYFDGSIDEVRVWNVVRTQSEIQDNMNQHITTPASGLVGYWKLNESSGTTAGDETANGNDGVLTNMTGDEWVHIFSKITTSCPGVQDNSTTTAWGDYNNDGYLDFVINGKTSSGDNISQIYKNNGDGTFTEQTGISLTGVHKGFAAWGDYNNDGFLDIVITGASESGYSERVAKLYKNNRDGTFTEQTGINLMDIGLSSQDWGDYNNDGLLDLLMMGYPEETGYGTYITNLYKNNGDNSFTLQTGMNFPGVREGDLNWGDYNNDGFLDFIITGDSHEYDDYTEIYKNNGDGTFTVQSNISLPELSYESDAAWGDYNNDGFLDLLLSGPSSPNNVTKLYVNNQDGTFTELTNTNFKGLEEPTLAWGDYNNDGFPDIISIGQFASGVSTTIYKNNQDGTFTEQIDINLQDVYMGDVHWGDYDNDNDLDLIITGYDPTPGQHEVTNIYENHTLEKNTPPYSSSSSRTFNVSCSILSVNSSTK